MQNLCYFPTLASGTSTRGHAHVLVRIDRFKPWRELIVTQRRRDRKGGFRGRKRVLVVRQWEQHKLDAELLRVVVFRELLQTWICRPTIWTKLQKRVLVSKSILRSSCVCVCSFLVPGLFTQFLSYQVHKCLQLNTRVGRSQTDREPWGFPWDRQLRGHSTEQRRDRDRSGTQHRSHRFFFFLERSR